MPQQYHHGVDQRQLFPKPPTQRFQAPEIPPTGTRQQSSQQQKQLQRSSQDVRRDPWFQQPPPQYSQIQQHRQQQPSIPIEVNEMGPTIQQGVIQRPMQQGSQSVTTGARPNGTVHSMKVQKQSHHCKVKVTVEVIVHQRKWKRQITRKQGKSKL